MKIFVAGGSGAVGRQLLPRLLQVGHEVVTITRSERNAHVMKSMGAHVLLAFVFDREAVIAAMTEPDRMQLSCFYELKGHHALGWRPSFSYPSLRK